MKAAVFSKAEYTQAKMPWVAYAIFDVHGEPKAQPRPRAFARKVSRISKITGKPEMAWTARVYDKGSAEEWKSCIASAVRKYLPEDPLSGPIKLYVSFIFPRPARLLRKKDPDGIIPHTSKPDADNCMKAVMDALTQLGMWIDDSQVCDQRATKNYAAKTGATGALIQIYRLEDKE